MVKAQDYGISFDYIDRSQDISAVVQRELLPNSRRIVQRNGVHLIKERGFHLLLMQQYYLRDDQCWHREF
jgi:hypothetical protein